MNLELIHSLFSQEKRDSALRTRDGMVNALRLFERDPQDIRFRRQVTQEYWKLLRFIIQRRIPLDGQSDITFTPEERLVIDHAYLSPSLIADESFRAEELHAIPLDGSIACMAEIKIHSLSSFFQTQYRFFMECRGHDRLRLRLDELRESLARERMSMLLLRAERDRTLDSSIPDRSQRQSLATLNQRLEALLNELLPRRIIVSRVQPLTEDARQAILTLENQLDSLNRERRTLYGHFHLTGGALGSRISSLDRLWEEGFTRVIELQGEESRASQDYLNIVQETTSVSPEKKTAFLEEWIKAIQAMSRVMAKRAHLEAEPWLTAPYPADLLQQMKDGLRMAESRDRDLFNNCRTRFAHPPRMILLPMLGHGFYDSRGNNLFVPLHSSESPLASLFAALGQYRWLMDDTNRIRTSYRNLPGHPVLAPSQLEERFIQQYFLFLSDTATEELLPAEAETWFRDFLCRRDTPPERNSAGAVREEQPATRGERFEFQVEELMDTVDSETDLSDLEQHLVIRRSLEREGCLDILLCNLPPDSDELEKLLNSLSRLAAAHRFRNLEL